MAGEPAGGAIVPRPAQAVEAAGGGFDGVVGAPIDYQVAQYLREDGWNIIPQAARDWAGQHAGAPIHDPVTGATQPYWFSDITPGEGPGPGATPAEFELFMFGRRGLAVVRGATDAFVASPGGSRWRQSRWDLPIDPAGIRNDHRRGAAPNTGSPDGPAGGAGSDAAVLEVLPANLVSDFGNLPLETQRFLVQPFVSTAKRPQQAVLHGETRVRAGRLVESLWTYLFNARWLSFAFLQREVVVRTPYRSAEEIWGGSPESQEITRTPWNLAAWVAPVVRDQSGPDAREIERT